MDARPDDAADDRDLTGADHPADPAEAARDAHDAPGGDAPSTGPAPEAAEPDDDEVWASIVARLTAGAEDRGDSADPAAGRTVRGARSDRDPDARQEDAAPSAAAASDAVASDAVARLVGRDWDGTTQYDAAEGAVDDLEHFVPEDPGPVLGGNPLLTLAWGAAVTMPVLLLVVVVMWRDAPSSLVRGAVAVFVVAVGVLVWHMPHRREPSDDDDGAVV